ncbi:MFS transporter [Candidatus Parcubacteria bacterium]|nr:MFS transporter [Candidatus Parcubacteria bacterium]
MTDKQRLALVIAVLASFVTFLDASVINVALPAISAELGEGLTLKQWVVDGYLITLGALMLIAGSLSDLFGRKKVLAIGLWGFAITSILCALAPSGAFLIVARILQGAAGALLVPSSLALIISVFSSGKQGKAIGTWTAWTGIAFIIGPLLGGFLVDIGSWRLIFAINIIPILVTLWLLRTLELEENLDKRPSVDITGALLGAIGLGGPVYALIEQPNYGWGSPLIYGSLLIGIAALAAFFWHERRTPAPMLPLSLFKVRNFSVGNLSTAAIYGSLGVLTFLLAVFVQQVGGYSAFEAGLTLLPVTLIMFVFSPFFGTLADKFGPRIFMSLGPIICAGGVLTFLWTNQSVNFWSQILPGILIFGIGLSFTVAPLTTAVLSSIEAKRAGIGSAINNALARIASLITIATLGFVVGPEINLEGFHKGVIYMAILLALGGIISCVGIRNPAKFKQ